MSKNNIPASTVRAWYGLDAPRVILGLIAGALIITGFRLAADAGIESAVWVVHHSLGICSYWAAAGYCLSALFMILSSVGGKKYSAVGFLLPFHGAAMSRCWMLAVGQASL